MIHPRFWQGASAGVDRDNRHNPHYPAPALQRFQFNPGFMFFFRVARGPASAFRVAPDPQDKPPELFGWAKHFS